MSGERGTVGRGDGFGPAPEGVGARSADPGRSFGAVHVGIKDANSCRSAIVVHENDKGIFADSPLIEFAEDAPHVFVDVVNHSEEALRVVGEVFVGVQRFVFGACVIRAVGGVGGDVGEKWFPCLVLRFHPASGLRVKNVGAVALSFFEGPVVENGGVEIGVCGGVATGAWVDLADSAAAVNEYFTKSAVVGLIGGFVSEVPFPKDTGGISGLTEHFGERYGFERHPLAFKDGVRDPVFELVSSG